MSLLAGLLVGLTIAMWGLLRGAEYAYVKLRRMKQALLVLVDGDGCNLDLKWADLDGNEATTGRGDKKTTYIVDGRARLAGNKTPRAWVVHRRHGWNLVVPTDQSTVHRERRLQVLALSNPASYRYAITHNQARHTLEAQRDNEHWVVKIAPFALIALIVVAIGIVAIGFKIYGAPA